MAEIDPAEFGTLVTIDEGDEIVNRYLVPDDLAWFDALDHGFGILDDGTILDPADYAEVTELLEQLGLGDSDDDV